MISSADNTNNPAPVSTGAPDGNGKNYDARNGEQAETAITAAGVFLVPSLVVGFNDMSLDSKIQYLPSPANPQTRTVTRGVSLMGYATSFDDGRTFTYFGKILPPVGWSALWGDPSIATDPNDKTLVYYSQMGVSDQAWNAVTGGADTYADSPGIHMVDGFCTARSTDGGKTFPDIKCVRIEATAGSIDRTATVVDNKGHVYVAHNDFIQGHTRIWNSNATWNDFTELAQKNLIGNEEPLLNRDPLGNIWLSARGGTDAIANRYSPDRLTWDSSISLANACGITLGKRDLKLGSGTLLRNAHSYNFAVAYNEDNTYVIRAALQLDRSDGRNYIQIIEIPSGPPQCIVPGPAPGQAYSSWSTGDLAQRQWQPNVTSFRDRSGQYEWHVSYMTNWGTPDSRKDYVRPELQRIRKFVDAGGTHRVLLFITSLSPNSWYACPRTDGYWGDYFGTVPFRASGGSDLMVSAFSDSRSAPNCGTSTDWKANPLHVASSNVLAP